MRKNERDIEREMRALQGLYSLFTDEGPQQTNFTRMLTAIEVMRNELIRSGSENLTEEVIQQRIVNSLMQDALVDPLDQQKAREQAKVIREGYEADPAHWDKWIGRRIKYQRNVRDLR